MRRLCWAAAILTIITVVIVARLWYLHVHQQARLQARSDERSMRLITIAPTRGLIVDRNGIPLAISSPVADIWADPRDFRPQGHAWQQLVQLLRLNPQDIAAYLQHHPDSRFIYLKRGITPHIAKQVLALKVPGVYRQRSYQRFYPHGAALANVIGVTNIDHHGQDGLELAYDHWLSGTPGTKQVIRDIKGHIVAANVIKPMQPGHTIALTIDLRLQHITFEALQAAVHKSKAIAASAVIVDAHSGEILAMANVPSFNPNYRSTVKPAARRNRAVTDVYEPGSVMKPMAMAAVLESGEYPLDYSVDTKLGWYRLQGNTVRDGSGYGVLDLTGIIQKSSNVGISKVVLGLQDPTGVPRVMRRLGFGQDVLMYLGAQSGRLPLYSAKQQFALATLSFGYGMTASTLQIARAYATIANQGRKPTVSLVKSTQSASSEAVLSPQVAHQLMDMLKVVVTQGGTGFRAVIQGYRAAGKTGTARKAKPGGYSSDYVALFAGIAPADNPRYVMVIMVDEPQGGYYYGGSIAAPVFRQVMQRILPMTGVKPLRRN